MFSKDITNSDHFIDMPLTSQCLYFHLNMNSDDDGFVSPKGIMRLIQAKDDDLKILIAKGFVIPFQDSVIVITHWKMNNNIRSDRYTPTIYKEHLKILGITDGAYQMTTNCHTIGIPSIGKDRIDKSSIDKNSIEEREEKNSFGIKGYVKLKSIEYDKLIQQYGNDIIEKYINDLEEYITTGKGKKYTDHYLTILKRLGNAGLKRPTKPDSKEHFDWYLKVIAGNRKYEDPLEPGKILTYGKTSYWHYLVTEYKMDKDKAKQIRDTFID